MLNIQSYVHFLKIYMYIYIYIYILNVYVYNCVSLKKKFVHENVHNYVILYKIVYFLKRKLSMFNIELCTFLKK